jgi:hypothetical protein
MYLMFIETLGWSPHDGRSGDTHISKHFAMPGQQN